MKDLISNKDKVLMMEVNRYFKTINYHMDDHFVLNEYYSCVIRTLSQLKQLDDCLKFLDMVLKFDDMFKTFVETLKNPINFEYYKGLKILPLQLNYLNHNIAEKIEYVTNALSKDYRLLHIFNCNMNGSTLSHKVSFRHVNGLNYHMSVPTKACPNIKIFSKTDRLLCTIVKKGHGFALQDNKDIKIDMRRAGNVTYLYHIGQVNNGEWKQSSIAKIEYGLTNNINRLGLVRYQIIDQTFDKEFLDFMMMGILLLLHF